MAESIIIVDYDAGNLRSVQRACQAVGVQAAISSDPEAVRQADRVIFPGVGTAESAMTTLEASGLDQALKSFASSGRPLLGICLGLQVLLDHTDEGNRSCLGLIPGQCRRFEFAEASFKVPQIGWNSAHQAVNHPVLAAVPDAAEFYFVHSFAFPVGDYTLAAASHSREFSAIVAHQNFLAVQFHPERSARWGALLLRNFVENGP